MNKREKETIRKLSKDASRLCEATSGVAGMRDLSSALWDLQLELDALSGDLDEKMAGIKEEALRDDKAGLSSPIEELICNCDSGRYVCPVHNRN